ncbi:DUF742 domain-containing protein [Streptomyces sp. NPDC096176]|uniref:DUF742 domain-containing protein n=1 Tax=Streptomyces sp. NPDC096176 TaxID=3366079 RepID=UPI0037F48598
MDDHWYEDETGSLVRPYTVTRGRTRPDTGIRLDLMSRISAVPGAAPRPGLDHARVSLLDLVRGAPRPVAEVAADADLPLTVVRVLLADLAAQGLIEVRPRARFAAPADPRLLREVAERLKHL